MPRDDEHNPDPNSNSGRIVGAPTQSTPDASGDLEAAWPAWSSHVQEVDERGMALVRAAFEAGRRKATNNRLSPCRRPNYHPLSSSFKLVIKLAIP